jgi:hypothetical protein
MKVIVRFNRSGNRSNDHAERTIRFLPCLDTFGTPEERDYRPLSGADQKVHRTVAQPNGVRTSVVHTGDRSGNRSGNRSE